MIDGRQESISKPRLAARGVLAFMLLVLLGLATAPAAQAQFTFANLYNFTSKTVGWQPYAGLIQDTGGNFYGTTLTGGAYLSGPSGGTVFKVTPTGAETTLYSFCASGASCLDGSGPQSALLMDSAGNLYGTVNAGGANNQGVVFELTPAPSGGVCLSGTYQGTGWCESVLYSFTNGSDGAYPLGKLIQDSSGNLYSTTSGGSPNGCGGVFELSPPASGSTTWTETSLYTFGGSGTGDACNPSAGLAFDGSGNLYGTANFGGVNTSASSAGNGAVYELTPGLGGTWTETFLYSFTGGSDGCFPLSDLAYQGGNLYGTASSCGVGVNGSVFELSSSGGTWTESTIFDFPASAEPYAGVVADPAGNLFGTTYLGGPGTGGGYGTVYKLSPPATPGGAWTESTVYAFGTGVGAHSANDRNPFGMVLLANGKLYGTTGSSTCTSSKCTAFGAVWSLTPPPPTVTVTSSLNPSLSGQSVTFSATITSAVGASVSGSVAWSSSSGSMTCTESGTSTTNVTTGNPGTTTCTTTSLAAGTDTITASYSGDSINKPSSGSFSQIVNAAGDTVSVVSTSNPSAYGQSVSFTATVASTSTGTPTGTVQFSIDGNAFGSQVPLVSGVASSASISTLTVGSPHTVTAAYSGDSIFPPNTGILSQNVNSAGENITVASSENPSTLGDGVTFTATINAANGLVRRRNGVKPMDVTGTVAWTVNGNPITGCGSTSVNVVNPGTSTATCTTATLAVGDDAITATYSGDSNHSTGSGNLPGGQTVNQATPDVTLNPNGSPAGNPYGQAISFRASVAPGCSPVCATGTLQFSIDDNALGSPVTVSGGGVVNSISISNLPVGSHSVCVSYSGDSNYLPNTVCISYSITAADVGVVVTSSQNPSVYGQSVTFTATMNAANGLVRRRNGVKPMDVTGTVAWSPNTGCGTVSVSYTTGTGMATATCTTTSLPVSPVGSPDQITANYSGDGNHSTGSGTLSQTVNTLTSVASTLNPSAYGQAVGFTATVSGSNPTGTVQFSIDGNLFDTETLSSGSASSISTNALTVGTHTITAVYSGDANNGPSTGSLSQIVSSASANVVVVSSRNPSAYGQSVTFTATINGANGLVRHRNLKVKPQDVAGSVTWSDSNGPLTCTESGTSTTTVTSGNPGTATCTLSNLAVNPSDTITANYSGDSNHNAGSGSVNQEVDAGGTTVSVASSLNPTVFGESVTFTATINAANGLVSHRNSAKPMDVTGSVAWSSDTGCGTTTVSYTTGTGIGTATCATTTLPVGSADQVTATYSGDSNHNGGTGTLAQQVNPPLLVPTIVWPTPAPITYGTPLGATKLNAKAKYGTHIVPGTFAYSPAAGTILTPGSHALSVTFTPTDTNTYATQTGSVTLVVNPIKPSMTITETKDGLILTVGFTVTARYGQPTGSVAVTSGTGGPTCNATLTSGTGTCTLTFSTGGTYTLTVTYSGDSNDESITETRTVSVSQLHTTTKITSITSPVIQNQPVTVNFSVTASLGQPTGTVTVTSNFGGPICTGTLTNGTGSCTLTGFASQGTYTLTVAYSGDSNDAVSSVNHNVRVVAP